jgi:hypothetical protein
MIITENKMQLYQQVFFLSETVDTIKMQKIKLDSDKRILQNKLKENKSSFNLDILETNIQQIVKRTIPVLKNGKPEVISKTISDAIKEMFSDISFTDIPEALWNAIATLAFKLLIYVLLAEIVFILTAYAIIPLSILPVVILGIQFLSEGVLFPILDQLVENVYAHEKYSATYIIVYRAVDFIRILPMGYVFGKLGIYGIKKLAITQGIRMCIEIISVFLKKYIPEDNTEAQWIIGVLGAVLHSVVMLIGTSNVINVLRHPNTYLSPQNLMAAAMGIHSDIYGK